MLNLSDITTEYIRVTFQQELQPLIFESFILMEAFGLKQYELKFEEMISSTDYVDQDELKDLFVVNVRWMLADIVEQHQIALDHDADIQLSELVSLCRFLYTVQRLEDTEFVMYRLCSDDTPRNIMISLAMKLTQMEEFRLMELVESVSGRFVQALTQLYTDRQLVQKQVSLSHRDGWNLFVKFTDNADCLGKMLYDKGFINHTLQDILSLQSFDITKHTESTMLKSLAQAGLDTISLLLLSTDHCERPLVGFEQSSKMFCSTTEGVSKLKAVVISLLNDYYEFKKADTDTKAFHAQELPT